MFHVILLVLSLQAPAAQDAPIARLEQSFGRLTLDVEKQPTRGAKIALLEQFHQNLRREIQARADSKDRSDYYWRVIDMDSTVVTIIERNCSELKDALIRQDRDAFPEDGAKTLPETDQALVLADLACAK